LFKLNAVIGHAAEHTVAGQCGKPTCIFTGNSQRYQRRSGGYNVKTKTAGHAQTEIAGTEFSDRQASTGQYHVGPYHTELDPIPSIRHIKRTIGQSINSLRLPPRLHLLPITR